MNRAKDPWIAVASSFVKVLGKKSYACLSLQKHSSGFPFLSTGEEGPQAGSPIACALRVNDHLR